ncbi:hypothetical protein OIU84_014562 [Salix udensis]|uniref:Protein DETOXIFICATION n=1 Tax=Salix udensis TaxID=889485 RepID=A0AAD6JCE2_9ROSI|nr:hypothetical protein OIU84_014562 [Salix udensis]
MGANMGWVCGRDKRVSCMAAPMMVASVTLYLLQVVSLMMAGHLSELSLSGVSIATSFTNVTGFSLLVGLSGGLETLCGQAYGAEQYKKFGSYTYCAIISLIATSIPVSVLWIFMDRLLIAIGQDPDISIVACQYAIRLIPALFAYSILQPLLRYFQSQSLIHPILTSTCAALCFHIPLCWALIYKWQLGNAGAAFAIGASYWLNVTLLALYMVFSSSCGKTRTIYWNDIFSSITKFFHLALPSAVMVCLEWWTFELVILLAGLLPDPKLQTSVLSVCLTTTTLHFYVQYGIGVAGSTRISNELGSGNHQAARVAVQAVLIISITEAAIASIILFFCRHIFGYAFSNDEGVVDYVAELAPPALSLTCLGRLTGNIFWDCQGMWVAARRSLCQPRSILSCCNPTSCSSLLCAASWKQRALDGTFNRECCSSNVICCHNCVDKLAKTGSHGQGEDLRGIHFS